MQEVLILGNGISRLLFKRFIDQWSGELWGCNLSYLEFGPKLTRLTGHPDLLDRADRFKQKNGYSFEIWGGEDWHRMHPHWHNFTCPRGFKKDSGTTMVAQALYEHRKVLACGFDLGGLDIHSPRHDNQDKYIWVERWRQIAGYFGLGNVEFLGHDHKPFILGNEPAKEYSRRYMSGSPHIPGVGYELAKTLYLSKHSRLSGTQCEGGIMATIRARCIRTHFTKGALYTEGKLYDLDLGVISHPENFITAGETPGRSLPQVIEEAREEAGKDSGEPVDDSSVSTPKSGRKKAGKNKAPAQAETSSDEGLPPPGMIESLSEKSLDELAMVMQEYDIPGRDAITTKAGMIVAILEAAGYSTEATDEAETAESTE